MPTNNRKLNADVVDAAIVDAADWIRFTRELKVAVAEKLDATLLMRLNALTVVAIADAIAAMVCPRFDYTNPCYMRLDQSQTAHSLVQPNFKTTCRYA